MRRKRLAVLLVFALVGAAAVILWIWPGDGSPNPTPPTPRDPGSAAGGRVSADAGGRPARSESGPQADRLAQALDEAVERAAALGGGVEAAVIASGWGQPLIAASEPGGQDRPMRMWSLSKVATMVALLDGLGWGERPGEPTSAEVDEALEGAIVRSENCRQRRVVLELQRVAGGEEAARAALAGVLRRSGAAAQVGTESEVPESICLPYLEAQTEVADPLAPALLLGTSTWRIGDAVRLLHGLATGAFGSALSQRVLTLMRVPKEASREVSPGELTAPLDWGAGRALAGLRPAYKAGWGGALNGEFLAAQIATVELPGDDALTIAVAFHPTGQPSRDDPGITAAPEAIELVMRTLRDAASNG